VPENRVDHRPNNPGRTERAILVLVCLVAIFPLMLTALAQIIRIEARSGCRTYLKALTRSLRWSS
jgi:hypothetical protein